MVLGDVECGRGSGEGGEVGGLVGAGIVYCIMLIVHVLKKI